MDKEVEEEDKKEEEEDKEEEEEEENDKKEEEEEEEEEKFSPEDLSSEKTDGMTRQLIKLYKDLPVDGGVSGFVVEFQARLGFGLFRLKEYHDQYF
ncbi:hypothetical protein M8J77_021749 [Diaphorina citri]|nr:hypothetical protein M8J77_021749 [Diaphorina citri]